MLLLWRVRYLDRRDKDFKNRDLWLDTDRLDPGLKAVVELCYELCGGKGRSMLRFRSLFTEHSFSSAELNALVSSHGECGGVYVYDYFEDEHGDELDARRMALEVTGDPNAILVPAGTPEYVIEYALGDKPAIEFDRIALPANALQTLGYFTRDLREMTSSPFFREKSPSLACTTGSVPFIKTSVTQEETAAFVLVFRRLFLEKERANLWKAASVYKRALRGHPLCKFMKGLVWEFRNDLAAAPAMVPFAEGRAFPLSRQQLLNAYLYTQYAHQPDDDMQAQFRQCLEAARNSRTALDWLFLSELHVCSLQIWNAGRLIGSFFEQYCRVHNVSPDVIPLISDNSDVLVTEKEQARRERLMQQKVEALAQALWTQRGSPEGGPMQFINEARQQITRAMGDPDDG